MLLLHLVEHLNYYQIQPFLDTLPSPRQAWLFRSRPDSRIWSSCIHQKQNRSFRERCWRMPSEEENVNSKAGGATAINKATERTPATERCAPPHAMSWTKARFLHQYSSCLNNRAQMHQLLKWAQGQSHTYFKTELDCTYRKDHVENN